MGEPDQFRLRYRNEIIEFVRAVVMARMGRGGAAKWIKKEADERILLDDQRKFVEVVESEISNLNEGNTARYQLLLSDFNAWKEVW